LLSRIVVSDHTKRRDATKRFCWFGT